MISRERVESILARLPRLTIGLVGDLFLDRYLELVPGAEELSIETGVEAWQIERVRNSPGALGTVMNNLAALGVGLLTPATVIGDDGNGFDLLREVRKLPVDTSQLMCVRDRLTPTYTKPLRPLADGTWEELNRLDFRTRAPISMEAIVELCGRVAHVFRSSDGVIVLDQLVDEDEGVVNGAIRETLAELHRQRPDKLVYVDSRRHLSKYKFGILKGNGEEVARAGQAIAAASATSNRDISPEQAAQLLSEQTGNTVYCTLGDRGIWVVGPGHGGTLVPGYPVTGPVDIVGAGDSATSGIATALLAGATPIEAAAFGNLVASITVQQLGTTGTASPDQVLARWDDVYAR
jgi:rfaE bifunctional protein kinase chain/domain